MIKFKLPFLFKFLPSLFLLSVLPSVALAHGGGEEGASMAAGPL